MYVILLTLLLLNQALTNPESYKWINIMDDEINSKERNKVWKLIEFSPDAKAIDNNWIFKRKLASK